MNDEPGSSDAAELARRADRLDALADMAELMGDDEGAARFRAQASGLCQRGMRLLDD